MSETNDQIVAKAIADALAEKEALDKAEAEKVAAAAAEAEKVASSKTIKHPRNTKVELPPPVVKAPPPPVRLRVLERFPINPGTGLIVFQRGDVLKQEDFEPRVWGDLLEMLDRKVAVL